MSTSIPDAAVAARGLVKYYGSFQALKGVSFTAPRRGITVILGPNGAGKTTTLRAISGALRISSGTVEVLGIDVSADPLRVKELIGVVPELPYLFPGLSVESNMKVAGRLHGLSGEKLSRRVREVAEEMGLTRFLHKKYGKLSKGFKRRVDVAAALIHEPSLLILDEPTGGLDLLASMRLRNKIKELASQGVSIIMSTHNVSEAAELADHAVILVDGRVCFEGPPDELRRMLGEGVEIIVVVEGDAERLASHIRSGSPIVEGKIIRVRVREVVGAVKDIIRSSEELGIRIRRLSMREASWEEIFSKLFRRGASSYSRNEDVAG